MPLLLGLKCFFIISALASMHKVHRLFAKVSTSMRVAINPHIPQPNLSF